MSFPGLYNEVTHARNPPKTINTSTVPCAAVLTHTRNTSTSNWCTPSTILKLILLLYLFTYVFVPIVPTARARTIPTAVQHALRTAIPTYYNTADIRTYIYYVLKKKVLLQGEDRYVLHLLTFCTQVTHLFLRMYVLNVPTVDASTYLVPGILFSLLFFFVPSHLLLSSPFFFSLPPGRNWDPGSHRGLYSHLPTTFRALHFIARRFQLFLPWSTYVELCLPS